MLNGSYERTGLYNEVCPTAIVRELCNEVGSTAIIRELGCTMKCVLIMKQIVNLIVITDCKNRIVRAVSGGSWTATTNEGVPTGRTKPTINTFDITRTGRTVRLSRLYITVASPGFLSLGL